MAREFSATDRFIGLLDSVVRFEPAAPGSARPSPADLEPAVNLSNAERRTAAQLLRVDHAGEVAAQALYQGQALFARSAALRQHLLQAAEEENDHLRWTATRLQELSDRPSLLSHFWYAGALAIGALAARQGDRQSLGFLAETEQQVVEHLDDHLAALPQSDRRSRAILEQMRLDEAEHASKALDAGAAPVPPLVRIGMRAMSKVMTTVARWV